MDAAAAFEPFDLSLSLGPGFVPWVSAASRLGHVHGIPRRDPLVPAPADLLDQVYDYADAVRFAERDGLPELRRALGQLVFGEPMVLELFQATRGAAADRGRELLVRILASPHLAALPWELLPDPGKSHVDGSGEQSPLALAPDASVVRLARGRTYPVRTEALEPPLNLLVVLSSPGAREPGDDELAFDIYEEKRSLLAELEPLVKAGLLCIDVEDQPTLQNLRRRVGARRRGYHLFHYIGHAEPDRLLLEDEEGRCDKQSASRFLEVLRLCPDLRLAVFAGCETARAARDPLALDPAAADGWRQILSLSDRCVQESCPLVVGMQAVLPFRTERVFTRAFYQGLASGYPVTAATRLARTATRGDRTAGGDLLDWSVPVLFVGGAEPGPLLDRSARGVPPSPPAQQVLRLGLRQGETRFFARDVELRQAIDVLTGHAPERMLVVAGPPEVGKTTLLDRVLEEIAGAATWAERSADEGGAAGLVLYVRLQDLAPELDDAASIASMDPQAPLRRLCDLVAELLLGADGIRREASAGQTASQWWVRLMEALGPRRTVLVIDGLDGLVKAEEARAGPIAADWLQQQMAQLGPAPVKPVQDLLEDLIDHVRHTVGSSQSNLRERNPLVSGLDDIGKRLGGRVSVIRRAVTAAAKSVLARHDGAEAPKADAVHAAEFERLAAVRQVLDEALRMVAERRSGARLAVVADRLPEGFLDLPSELRFVLRLGRLTWGETWRWIRRNLPGLLRHGGDYLERFWPRLGADLALWEELERRVLEPVQKAPDIEALVDRIAPGVSPGGKRPGGWTLAPRGERPLRVAIAGPLIASPAALARAINRLAREHGVGGRIVTDEDDARGSLAVLVDVPSPFSTRTGPSEAEVIDFLRAASAQAPDIVLLDYGYDVPLPLPGAGEHERPLLAQLRHRALLVAAGGNEGLVRGRKAVSAPAAYQEVLAVGSLDEVGRLQPYSDWSPALRKPDLFMADQLVGTAFECALSEEALDSGGAQSAFGPGTHGSSFAAIHAVGAAILAWSTLPELDPDELHGLLRRACKWVPPAPDGLEARPRWLTVAAAVGEARREVVRRALSEGPCSPVALAGLTGLAPRLVNTTLHELDEAHEVRRLTRGRFERYELVVAL